MNPQQTSRRHRVVRVISLLVRCLLGVVFIYMGLTKAFAPEDFLKIIRQYDLIQNHVLLNAVAAVLPWFEVFCGGLLLAGIAVRGTATLLMLLLGVFTWMVIQRALSIMSLKSIPFCAVQFNCGCGTGEILICGKIAENFCLVALAVCLIALNRNRPIQNKPTGSL